MIDLVIYRHLPTTAPQSEIDSWLDKITKEAQKLQDFYAYRSVPISVTPSYLLSDTLRISEANFGIREYQQFARDQGWRSFYDGYGVWGGSSTSCGHAWGNGFVVYGTCFKPSWAFAHEAGHLLGAHHSGELSATGKTSEYGGWDCVMGEGYTLCAPKYLEAGAPIVTKTITESTTIKLCPPEFHARDLRHGEYQLAIIELGSKRGYLSVRADRGYFGAITNKPAASLYIHETTREGRMSTLLHQHQVLPGETRRPWPGVEIDYLNFADQTAEVSIGRE